MLPAIIQAVININNSYGYGDVLGVVMAKDWTTGVVTIKRTSSLPETRKLRFNIATNTVFFAKHQSRI
jgi:hypothetical protein